MTNHNIKILFILILNLLFTGCASISGDDTNKLSRIESEPTAAKCQIINSINIKRDITTPADVFLQPKYDPINISCEKEGYKRSSDVIDTTLVDAVYGNILLGGLIGVAIDHSSGQNRKYPSTIKVFLEPNTFASNEERIAFENKKNIWRTAILDGQDTPDSSLQPINKSPKRPKTSGTNISKRNVAVTAWGTIDETRFTVKIPQYSKKISLLMQTSLQNETSGNIAALNWRDAKDINYDGNGNQISRSICTRTNVDVIYAITLEVDSTGGTAGHYPDATYYRYSCSDNRMIFKTYTLDLDRQDKPSFLYETRLHENFQHFLALNGVN